MDANDDRGGSGLLDEPFKDQQHPDPSAPSTIPEAQYKKTPAQLRANRLYRQRKKHEKDELELLVALKQQELEQLASENSCLTSKSRVLQRLLHFADFQLENQLEHGLGAKPNSSNSSSTSSCHCFPPPPPCPAAAAAAPAGHGPPRMTAEGVECQRPLPQQVNVESTHSQRPQVGPRREPETLYPTPPAAPSWDATLKKDINAFRASYCHIMSEAVPLVHRIIAANARTGQAGGQYSQEGSTGGAVRRHSPFQVPAGEHLGGTGVPLQWGAEAAAEGPHPSGGLPASDWAAAVPATSSAAGAGDFVAGCSFGAEAAAQAAAEATAAAGPGFFGAGCGFGAAGAAQAAAEATAAAGAGDLGAGCSFRAAAAAQAAAEAAMAAGEDRRRVTEELMPRMFKQHMVFASKYDFCMDYLESLNMETGEQVDQPLWPMLHELAQLLRTRLTPQQLQELATARQLLGGRFANLKARRNQLSQLMQQQLAAQQAAPGGELLSALGVDGDKGLPQIELATALSAELRRELATELSLMHCYHETIGPMPIAELWVMAYPFLPNLPLLMAMVLGLGPLT